MKIRYLAASPKVGQVEHIRNDVGVTLIAAGFAEAVPYKDFRERLREESQNATDAHNVNPNFTKNGEVQWSVDAKSFDKPVIVKRQRSETTYYAGPSAEMPQSVIELFQSLSDTGSPHNSTAQLEADQRKQAEYEHSIRDVRRY